MDNVRSEDATATVAADLEAIQALIRKTSGGNATIDSTVKRFLRRWFVTHGGVNVAARRSQARGSRADAASSNTRRVSRVAVARFVTKRTGDAGNGTAAAAAVWMRINNPAYDGQAVYEGTADPQATLPFLPGLPPAAQRAVPQTSVPAGRPPARPPMYRATAFSRAHGSTDHGYEVELPADALASLPGAGVGGLGRARNDGGYMAVGATPPGRLDSDVSLITDTSFHRWASDVSSVAGPGLGARRSESEL